MPMKQLNGFFITGTCTEVGKTAVACGLLTTLNHQGYRTIGLKPIASDSHETDAGLRNDDALTLQHSASVKLPYHQVNPYPFAPPIAPHIAAQHLQQTLTAKKIIDHVYDVTHNTNHDFCIVEGCGGWEAPLNDRESFVDIAKALKLPVILVVGMKLGCLNHAKLTYRALRQDGMQIAGWVANRIDPSMRVYDENIACLKKIIDAPLLANVPHLKPVSYDQISTCFPHQFPTDLTVR